MQTEKEKVMKLRDDIISQDNRANLTPREAIVWALQTRYTQIAEKLSYQPCKKIATDLAKRRARALMYEDPDYRSALKKMADYITTHHPSGEAR